MKSIINVVWRLYHSAMRAFALGTVVAGRFSDKARLRAAGAASTLEAMPTTPVGQACVWMHCASVGEFEQGRPVWEALMSRLPEARFVLTFFSPSGAEVFRSRADIGEVYYLPWDYPAEVARFAERLYPSASRIAGALPVQLALFVKYEWWLGYHRELFVRSIPTVLISGAFRQNQPFFRPWHPAHQLYRQALSRLQIAFVQTAESCALLARHHYETPCRITGDTRLDRVLALRDTPFVDPVIEAWRAQQNFVLVAGSTWPADEALLLDGLRSHPNLSILLAPHEIGLKVRNRIEETFRAFRPVFYTDADAQATPTWPEASAGTSSRILVLDTIGLLSRAYRYGQLAYVGGGFGAGIHNTLEPAVYGIPVAFGPRHLRFAEAIQLQAAGIAFAVAGAADLSNFVTRFSDVDHAGERKGSAQRDEVMAKADLYTMEHRGATARIMKALEEAQLI